MLVKYTIWDGYGIATCIPAQPASQDVILKLVTSLRVDWQSPLSGPESWSNGYVQFESLYAVIIVLATHCPRVRAASKIAIKCTKEGILVFFIAFWNEQIQEIEWAIYMVAKRRQG